MPQLPETLAQFYEAIANNETQLADHILTKGGISGEDRLNIYQRSINGIHADALTSIYPCVDKLTGNQFFRAMCKRYLRDYPSPSGDLHQIGRHMGRFIKAFEPAAGLPYLADVARLEWLWHSVFHKTDCADSNLHELASIAEDDHDKLIFLLRPASALLKSEYPVYQIWQANQQADDDTQIDLDSGTETLVIYRLNKEMHIANTDPDSWAFLSGVSSGNTLDELSARHAIDELLPQCVQKGWITHYKIM